MNSTNKSIAVGEQNHGVKACLTKKAAEEPSCLTRPTTGTSPSCTTDNDDVSSKSATEVTVMMNNTATLRPAYSLNATVNAEYEIEVPPDQHDNHDQAEMLEDMKEKKIATLDALFPKIRVPSDDEYMHEKTPAVKAAKTTLYAKSEFAKTYKEDGSRAETVMTMTLHHPTDYQDQTTSPALTMMREQVDDEVQTEVKMAPFATEGAEGIAKCPSTWPAHFAAVTRQHYTASFTSKARQLFICLTDPAQTTP